MVNLFFKNIFINLSNKLILHFYHFLDKNSQESTAVSKNDVESKVNLMKDSAMEAELKAARERAVVPLETRITQFREMLSEKEVN